jgi:hypothetical protein
VLLFSPLFDRDIPADECAAGGITVTQRYAKIIGASIDAVISENGVEGDLAAMVIQWSRASDRRGVAADDETANSRSRKRDAGIEVDKGEKARRTIA